MRRLVLLALLVAICSPAFGRSVREEFAPLWAARLSQYQAEQAATRQRVEDAAKPPSDSDPARAEAHYANLLQALVADGEVKGREQVASDLIAHMRNKPSAELSEAWIQGLADRVKRDRDDLNSRSEALKRQGSAKLIAPKEYFEETFKLAATAGIIRGRASELALIDQNLRSFYQAKGGQDEQRRRARAAFFGALAGSFGSTPAPPSPPWIATCQTTAFGNSTTCRGQ